jgi:hypothetical protein
MLKSVNPRAMNARTSVPGLWQDPQCARVEQFAEPTRVAGEPEEAVLLLDDFRGDLVLRAAALDELISRVEAFAPHAVEAAIRPPVDVPCADARLPEPLRAVEVSPVTGRPDEVVVADVEPGRQPPEDLRIAVHQRAHRKAFTLGGQDIRQAVLVGAGQEPGVIAAEAVVAGEDIRLDQLERKAEVRLSVDIRNGGRDIERAHRVPPPAVGPWPRREQARRPREWGPHP